MDGLEDFTSSSPDPICEPCLHGKQHRHNILRTSTPRSRCILAYIHTDLKGPFPTQSSEDYRYWILFVDDSSDWWSIDFLHWKSDAFASIKTFVARVENEHSLTIQVFCDDAGGEFLGKDFDLWCKEKGIARDHTETGEPHQNGRAERANCTVAKGSASILA